MWFVGLLAGLLAGAVFQSMGAALVLGAIGAIGAIVLPLVAKTGRVSKAGVPLSEAGPVPEPDIVALQRRIDLLERRLVAVETGLASASTAPLTLLAAPPTAAFAFPTRRLPVAAAMPANSAGRISMPVKPAATESTPAATLAPVPVPVHVHVPEAKPVISAQVTAAVAPPVVTPVMPSGVVPSPPAIPAVPRITAPAPSPRPRP
ncbi:hypothetical protein QN397_19795, partial [Variovorax sp. RTB1]|nr:hypothetical protein [Variovorax sp. RTB1]